MVDALTGDLLWSAGNDDSHDLELPAMTHSIPAGIRVLDIDQDRLADRMYVGDMGGRVWRFDISNGEPVADLVNGGVFASLGGAAPGAVAPADVRRFYATPDVARIDLRQEVLPERQPRLRPSRAPARHGHRR